MLQANLSDDGITDPVWTTHYRTVRCAHDPNLREETCVDQLILALEHVQGHGGQEYTGCDLYASATIHGEADRQIALVVRKMDSFGVVTWNIAKLPKGFTRLRACVLR